MKQIAAFLASFTGYVFSFLFGTLLSGLVWDELSHQIKERGIVQKICHAIIALASKRIPEESRDEFVRVVVSEIEYKLSDKRYLSAFLNSFSVYWSIGLAVFVFTVLHLICMSVSFYLIWASKSDNIFVLFGAAAPVLVAWTFLFLEHINSILNSRGNLSLIRKMRPRCKLSFTPKAPEPIMFAVVALVFILLIFSFFLVAFGSLAGSIAVISLMFEMVALSYSHRTEKFATSFK